MSVRIRLSRIGKRHVPFYRVISVDKRKKRDGAFLEDLGTYDVLNSTIVRFDEEGYDRRIEQGAIPSDAVKKIYMLFKTGATKKVEKPAKKTAPKKAAAPKEPEVPKEAPKEASQEESQKELTESKTESNE